MGVSHRYRQRSAVDLAVAGPVNLGQSAARPVSLWCFDRSRGEGVSRLAVPGMAKIDRVDFAIPNESIPDAHVVAAGLRGSGRKYGTSFSGWQKQRLSRIGGLDHAPLYQSPSRDRPRLR